ncbi:MAG: sensor histidine kinase [Synergistaceae bacterium]|nr:sensor histidine kinase [Synergistaceae bacterium]
MLRRKLLAILFICILLPVLVVLFESASTVMSQKKSTTDIAGRYAQNLANYASDRWNDAGATEITTFLSLVADNGYESLLSDGYSPKARDKFIPGMVAYVTRRGDLISNSKNAAVLASIFSSSMANTQGQAPDNGNIVGSFMMGDNHVSYVAHISSTRDPRVFAIAAVTMLSWMGRNDFNIMKLAFAGTLGMAISLIGLFLLRGSVITPLQALSSQVNTLKWGTEAPSPDSGGISGRFRVDEISSLKTAITGLAHRMIEKDALEKRYVGDIIKAQEDERRRIAQDIHDGPIQVVSALIQRIQMLNITSPRLPEDAARQLATAEDVACDLVEDLRGVCDSLLPPWVSLGIVSCIEEAASRFERQHSITVNTSVDQELDLPQEATLAIFRIFQEAVSNAVRHGGASVVNVEALKRDDGIEFKISDNGAGFEPDGKTADELVQEGKRGLSGMRRRVEMLGGKFDLWSEPGKGTTITVRMIGGSDDDAVANGKLQG